MKTKFNGILTLLLALMVQMTFAQERTITGKVSDETGPLPGVSVLIDGTSKGTETNFDGNYSIQANRGDVLRFSFVGMTTVTRTVGNDNIINIALASESNTLDEVIVTGYGTQKRSEVTGAISSVDGQDIQGLVTPSFATQLAGRSAGVQVTQNTGIVGESPRVRIRGVASIGSGTAPLYVVDGMPIYSGDIGGYASASGLGDINPNDIESFEILKDGAASAIYGSRAANGVILITTKKGKKGTMKLSFNAVTGFASAINTFDLLETEDFLVISNEKRTNRAQAPWAIGNEFNTDWQDEVLNDNALQVDYNFSMNGGTDKTKYFMSFGYTDQDGVAISNSMKRYSMRANLEHDIYNWLTVGGNLAVTRTEYEGLNTGGNSLSGNIFNATRQLPNTPVLNPEHPTGYNLTADNNFVGQWDNTDPVGDNISNIAYVLSKNKYESKINRTLAGAFASITFTEGLKYRLQASADNPITTGFLYWNPIHGDGRGSNGRLQNNSTDLLRWNIQNILTYDKTFADAHNLSLTGVAEYQKEENQSFYGYGTNLLDEFYNQNLVTGSYGTQESGGGMSENGIMSYVGRASYNYKQKYFLQGSIRRDGISKLDEDYRWNNFTGYSAGWNLANEGFFKGWNTGITELKLRASYSEVGNTDIGDYPYLGLTSPSQYGTLNGIAYTQFGNDQLLWETSKKTDYGLDLAMFNNRFRFTFDYFNNDIDGLILNAPVPHSLGVPNNIIKKNIGSMRNQGYEFSADWQVIAGNSFSWNLSGNVTFDENEVVSTTNGQDILGGTFTDANYAQNLIIREGEPINSLYGFRYWGSNPANGNPVYYKADGTLVQGNLPTATYFVFDPSNPADITQAATLSTATDKVVLGTTLPTYYGGINNKLDYKNWDLSFLFRFSGGNKIFNSTGRDLMTQNLNNNSTAILGRWQSVDEPGDGVTPRLWASTNTFTNLTGNATTRFVEDGDFISLDNVTLGYKMPSERLGLELVRFFVQGQNLWTITDYTGINPEMEAGGVDLNGTPRTQIVSFGVNVNF